MPPTKRARTPRPAGQGVPGAAEPAPRKRARKAVSAAAGTSPTTSGTGASEVAASAAPAEPAAPSGTAEPHELRLDLPFLTLTVTRPAHGHRPGREPAAGRPAAGKPATPVPETESGQRLLFYGGVAALGIAGVIEWPVAAAIAAGTWIASRARSSRDQPRPRPALPAGSTPTPAGTQPTPAGTQPTPAGSQPTPSV